jgi:hypothetical protein
MPARQDQTLQIALIVFIFLFLVCAVVAYLGWRGYSDEFQRSAGLQTQLQEKNALNEAQRATIEERQQQMGFGPNENPDDLKKGFENDMTTYGSGIDEASRSYRKVLEAVAAEGINSAKREAKLKLDVKTLNDTLAAIEATKNKQIDEFKAASEKAKEDAANQKNQFDKDRVALEASQKQLQKSLDDQTAKYTKDIEDRDKNIKDLTARVEKYAHANKVLIEERKSEPGSFEVADGRISSVNQNGIVWVNLGSADSLRRQVTFSVFDADLHDAAKAVKKGSIEITQIMGEHMAEARITDDDPKNPIITGDQIYSQIWHRGRKLRFALTGFIDLDGDGQSDMELARKLIALNDGVVDAYVNDAGKMEGTITANTRYLVLGDLPDSPTQGELQKTWHAMTGEASSMGVKTITIDDFMTQMGYKPQEKTLHLGRGAAAREFPPRREHASVTPNTLFRPRPAQPAPARTTVTPPTATATSPPQAPAPKAAAGAPAAEAAQPAAVAPTQ